MSDQQFREIQLSGKQLVFLFMASVVLAVSVFLLGVSVGRGVRDADGPASAAGEGAPDPLTAPEDMPAATELSERDSAFEQLLPGGSADSGTSLRDVSGPAAGPDSDREPPAPVNEPVEVGEAPEPVAEPESPRPTASEQPPASPERAASASPRSVPAARSTPAGQFTVQVNAYRSRASAEREMASLKQKGFDAYVDSSNGLFRVRVGSYPNRGDAERIAARLRQEGITPLITR